MSTVFYRGMVVDIINSVSGLTTRKKSIEDYQKLINTPNLKSFPRNTIVVKQISEGASKISNNEIICYPFFSFVRIFLLKYIYQQRYIIFFRKSIFFPIRR